MTSAQEKFLRIPITSFVSLGSSRKMTFGCASATWTRAVLMSNVHMAYDKDGRLTGSRIVNLKMFKKLNRDYPKKMQERGWDVNELKSYNAEAVKDMTPEEAVEYKEKLIAEKERRQRIHGDKRG